MANLRRRRDGAGDVGSSVQAIRLQPKDKGGVEIIQTTKPIVGWALRVGSVTARSYSDQDWWMTTPVTEILEEDEDEYYYYCKFKTGNSVYEFWTGTPPDEKFDWLDKNNS